MLNAHRVEIVGQAIDVTKNRPYSQPLQRVGCGDKSKGGCNYFIFQPQGVNGDFQGNGGVTDGKAVFHAKFFTYFLFKLFDQWAMIC